MCIERLPMACHQRSRLGVVRGFEFRQPVTEVDNCNIANVLFISQIYNVKLELKHNKEQMLRLNSSSPNNAKPNVGCWAFVNKLAQNMVIYFTSKLFFRKIFNRMKILSIDTVRVYSTKFCGVYLQ